MPICYICGQPIAIGAGGQSPWKHAACEKCTMFTVALVADENYPVYSLDTHLSDYNRNRQIEVTVEELYTAWIYENLCDKGQGYMASFLDRLV